jgi:plasmid stabilization system protein ParE
MKRRAVIRRLAQQDIREARRWYQKVSPALAEDFLASVDAAIDLVMQQPLAFPLVQRTFRRILLRRFPYSLFYQVDEQAIVVVAVLHQARDPEHLAER